MDGKIFGIGLSKTGTTSLYAALQMLGLPTATFSQFRRLGLDEWLAGDFSRDYLADYEAATDLPIGTYFRELDARFPGSKFILTTRPEDAWLTSIERQFTENPDPPRFHRDVRMGAYGVATFHAERFRRLWREHEAAVRAWFADRPDDLLVLDLFSGDGWDQLCTFLDLPSPDVPFPNVKPGHFEGLAGAQAGPAKFAFVVPVVHPKAPKVANYDTIEAALKVSITSYLAQQEVPSEVVVLAHRRPDWTDTFGDRLHMIVLDDAPGFAPGSNPVQEDKGMKYILGALYAAERIKATHIMLADADDFASRRLAPEVVQILERSFDDGVLLMRGVHALVSPQNASLALKAAFEVDEFHETCGTCRVFRTEVLHRKILDALPDLRENAALARDGALTDAVLAAVTDAGTSRVGDPTTLIHTLGRHVHQDRHFALHPVQRSWVAKGCGHGNHDSSEQGDIHWHRVRRLMGRKKFAARFGVEAALDLAPQADVGAVMRGAANVIRRKLRKKR